MWIRRMMRGGEEGVVDDEERESPVSDAGKSHHVHHPNFSSALRLSASDSSAPVSYAAVCDRHVSVSTSEVCKSRLTPRSQTPRSQTCLEGVLALRTPCAWPPENAFGPKTRLAFSGVRGAARAGSTEGAGPGSGRDQFSPKTRLDGWEFSAKTLRRFSGSWSFLRRAMLEAGGDRERRCDPYVVVAGWRYVRPYEARLVYRVKKERHSGLPDAQVLAEMFPHASAEFWQGEIDEGRAASIDASAGDLRQLVVTRHVHEKAIVAAGCDVIYEDEHLLAINKPAGISTLNELQGVGYNTALGFMQHRMDGACKLIPMHRLDKPVSGVLLLVKTQPGQQVRDPLVRKIQKHITKHKVRKIYLARVLGTFPSEPVTCTAALAWCDNGARGRASVSLEEGKESETRFTLIRVDGETSLVQCEPITGRPHQIRAHLQYLGHPIANDVAYGGNARYVDVEEAHHLQKVFLY
jgi:RluA family pseudouridine synthase